MLKKIALLSTILLYGCGGSGGSYYSDGYSSYPSIENSINSLAETMRNNANQTMDYLNQRTMMRAYQNQGNVYFPAHNTNNIYWKQMY